MILYFYHNRRTTNMMLFTDCQQYVSRLLLCFCWLITSLVNSQSNDPNLKTSQAITKFLPLMIGYFALSVPSGLSLYWFTNNILSTAQQVWLQKLGGAKNPVKQYNDDMVRKELSQTHKSISQTTTAKKMDIGGEKLTSEGLRPGERFKQLKEQEARRRQQQEEEKRKAEEAAIQLKNGEPKIEVNLGGVEPGRVAEDSATGNGNFSSNERHVVNGASSSPKVKNDIITMDYSDSHEDERINQELYGTTEKDEVAAVIVGADVKCSGKRENENKSEQAWKSSN